MKTAFVLYPDFTALDAIGPYEVISRWPDADVHFLASSSGPVGTDCGLAVIPTDTPETLLDPDLIVVPGSGNPLPVLDDRVLIDWLRRAAPGCKWTASVCTGAGLYAAGGLLDGKKTSTHWGFRDVVRAYGVEVVEDRVVWQGNHISCAGISAGIDMALTLTERVHGRDLAEALQLVIEYDPQPPFDTGSLEKPTPRPSGAPWRSLWRRPVSPGCRSLRRWGAQSCARASPGLAGRSREAAPKRDGRPRRRANSRPGRTRGGKRWCRSKSSTIAKWQRQSMAAFLHIEKVVPAAQVWRAWCCATAACTDQTPD